MALPCLHTPNVTFSCISDSSGADVYIEADLPGVDQEALEYQVRALIAACKTQIRTTPVLQSALTHVQRAIRPQCRGRSEMDRRDKERNTDRSRKRYVERVLRCLIVRYAGGD